MRIRCSSAPLSPYNRMQMQLSSDVQIPEGLLAANALLAENSRQGFGASTHTVYQGFAVAISSTALGIPGTLYDGRVRCRYTGKERDAESGLDYFGARYYASSMGRFMSPDPLEPVIAPKKVFFQVLMYPQDWNRYAYALNNPVGYRDDTGNFTGRDHAAIEVAALTASGYSMKAAQRAAASDAAMDTFHNMASGVPFLSMFVDGSENPQHGEQNGNQGVQNAKDDANDFINTKLDAATTAALAGNVGAALDDIGQASHTPQDAVRHQWEVSEDHPLGEAPASAAEKQQAIQKTEKLLGAFETKVRTAGAKAGLNADQTNAIIQKVKDGPK